jgi:hypothetical protein
MSSNDETSYIPSDTFIGETKSGSTRPLPSVKRAGVAAKGDTKGETKVVKVKATTVVVTGGMMMKKKDSSVNTRRRIKK